MKTLALSICALSGAIMASAGVLAEQFEHTRRLNNVDGLGMAIAIIATLATIVQAFRQT